MEVLEKLREDMRARLRRHGLPSCCLEEADCVLRAFISQREEVEADHYLGGPTGERRMWDDVPLACREPQTIIVPRQKQSLHEAAMAAHDAYFDEPMPARGTAEYALWEKVAAAVSVALKEEG